MPPGPPPKPHGARRRRNQPTFNWTYLPASGRKGRPPALPDLEDFSDGIKRWWNDVWHSPAATQWIDSDKHLLVELAVLKNHFEGGDHRASLAAEIRLRSDQLGLTPKGRQSLRWIVTDEEESRSVVAGGDRWSNLRVVDESPKEI